MLTGGAAMLLRAGRVAGVITDLLIVAGRVAAMGADLARPAGYEVVDLDGRIVLPGLWDNHVHFDHWALHRQRLDLSGARSAAAVVELVTARLRTDPPPGGAPPSGGT